MDFENRVLLYTLNWLASLGLSYVSNPPASATKQGYMNLLSKVYSSFNLVIERRFCSSYTKQEVDNVFLLLDVKRQEMRHD